MTSHSRHFWISPGALLGVVAAFCAIALLVVFVALPFYSQQGAQADRQQAGIQLLQTFDCTYGKSLDGALTELIKIQEAQAKRGLLTIQEAREANDPDREAQGRRLRADALESVGRVTLLREQLVPLSPATPVC